MFVCPINAICGDIRRVKLSIDDDQAVRFVGTRDYDFHLLKIPDLIGRNF